MPNTATIRAIRRPRKPFRDSNYLTWLGTQRLYSLSRVLRDLGLKPDFGDTPFEVIHRAACRGKLTEQYCFALLQGRGVTVRARHTGSLQAEVSQRVEAFYRWQQAYKPEYVDHHGFAWSLEDRVCWQRDFRAVINGQLTLVDIKCTSKPEKDWPLQIGCGLSYDEDGCNHGAILHLNPRLNKDGYKFRQYHGEQVKSWWRRTVQRWHSNYDFNRLRGELGFTNEATGFEVEEDS